MKASGRRRAAVRSGIARKRSILETDWAADLPMTRISSVCSCYERAKGQTLRGRWPVSGRDELGLDTGLWGFAPPPGFSAPIHLARILLLESGEDPPPLCNRQPFSLRFYTLAFPCPKNEISVDFVGEKLSFFDLFETVFLFFPIKNTPTSIESFICV